MQLQNLAYLGAGVAIGYFATLKLLDKKYSTKLENELAKTKEFYDKKFAEEDSRLSEHWKKELERVESQTTPVPVKEAEEAEREITQTVSDLVEPAAKAFVNYSQGPMSMPVSTARNMLVESATKVADSLDMPVEEPIPLVDPDDPYTAAPYVIDAEAFLDSETDYSQSTLTYYKGDFTLADESDEVMDTDWTVSHVRFENLNKFGEKSGDPNVVYVRCEQHKMEFEILLDKGKYAVKVAGIEES